MKTWKLWTFGSLFVIVLAAVAVTSAVWNNLSHEWSVEESAAQFALNHSPIDAITGHDVFTANDAEEVFYGTDSFGRKWISFVSGSPFTVHSVEGAGILSEQKIRNIAQKQGEKVISVHLGYMNTNAAGTTQTSDVVWEVYAQIKGSYKYYFYDAKTGHVLNSY